MNQKMFSEFMEERGFKVCGSVAFGVERDYPISVTYLAARQWKVALSVEVEDKKALFREMKEEKLGRAYSYADGHLSWQVMVAGKQYREQFEKQLGVVVDFLRQHGIRPTHVCPVCGQAGCDALAYHKEGYDPVHQRCIEQMIVDVREKAEKNRASGNYLTGILGAILGAFVGALPTVLSVVLAEKIYAILFALIPLCVYQGYKVCKGKMNKAVIVITILLSVVGVYLVEMLLLVVAIISEFGLGLVDSLLFLGVSLLNPEFWAVMTEDAGITSFAFLALGIWFSWGKISRTAQTEVRSAESLRDTILPYGLAAGDPAPAVEAPAPQSPEPVPEEA